MNDININRIPGSKCLNMIVKDEEHVIRETLESISPYISYYVIYDTGSTDNTIGVIKDFFSKKKIDGKVFQGEFRNFEYARTEGLKLACEHSPTDYIWIIDADDIIIGTPIFPSPMVKDCYFLQFGNDFLYHRCQIFKNRQVYNWHYIGWVHEYPESKKMGKTEDTIDGCYIESRRLGSRNKNPNKYLSDAKLLEESYSLRPNSRDLFYCANSYFDHVSMEETFADNPEYKNSRSEFLNMAKIKYEERIAIEEFPEEKFYSYLRLGETLEKLEYPWDEIERVYLDGASYFPPRKMEAIYKIMMHYYFLEDWISAYKFGKMAVACPFPSRCRLFIQKNIYTHSFVINFGVAASKLNKLLTTYITNKVISEKLDIPKHVKEAVDYNLKYVSSSGKGNKNRNCLIYVGYRKCEASFKELVYILRLVYNVYIVGQAVDMSIVTDENVFVVNMKEVDTIGINFEKVFLYDNINYLVEHKKRLNKNIALIQYGINFRYVMKNGKSISIRNKTYLDPILKKVNCIMSSSQIKNILQLENTTDVQNLDNLLEIIDILEPGDFSSFNREYVSKDSMYVDQYNNLNFDIPLYINNDKCDIRIKSEFVDSAINTAGSIFPELKIYQSIVQDLAGNTADALATLNKLKIPGQGQYVVDMYKAKYFHKMKMYSKAYTLANNSFDNLRLDLGGDHDFYEEIKDINVQHIKNNMNLYPLKQIKNIRVKSLIESKIIMTMTTCKRFDLFEKTVNSFIRCCNDIHLIDHFICIDDNSSDSDRENMKRLYPFFTFILKNENEKGHIRSMNIIYDIVISNPSIKQVLHMEDDFMFFSSRNYIGDSKRILENDKNGVMQVLFNRNYAEIEPYKRALPGGIMHYIGNLRYVVHEHEKVGSQKYNELVKKYEKCGGTQIYWPHFSFRPSVISADVYRELGAFANTAHFEMNYAKDFVKKGFKSAFFDSFCCEHIGKKTWEQGNNAYNLNNVNQFSGIKKCNRIVIIDDGKCINNSIKLKLNDIGMSYEFVEVDRVDESIINSNMFKNNTFNYVREIVDELYCNYKILRELATDNCYSKMMVISNKCIFESSDLNIIELFDYNGCIGICSDINFGYVIDKETAIRVVNDIDRNGFISYNLFRNEFIKNNENKYLSVNSFSVRENIISTLKNIDQYKFYSGLDSFGNDIRHVGKIPVEEIARLCDEDDDAVCFNTNGYIKYKTNNNLCDLYNSYDISEGLYIKQKN